MTQALPAEAVSPLPRGKTGSRSVVRIQRCCCYREVEEDTTARSTTTFKTWVFRKNHAAVSLIELLYLHDTQYPKNIY